MEHWIDKFVIDLSKVSSAPLLTNFYRGAQPDARARRANLATYLKTATARRPRILLVGEAPGYRGTRRTGVPFASERLLDSQPACQRILGRDRPFTTPNRLPPRAEATSTIVWRVLREVDRDVLLWAAVPFHPHSGDIDTNRRPTPSEVDQCLPFLRRIHAATKPEATVALGEVAEAALTKLGVPCIRIRHPARGGARAFSDGLVRTIDDLDSFGSVCSTAR